MRAFLARLGAAARAAVPAAVRGLRSVAAFALFAVGFAFGLLERLAQAAAELVAPAD